MPTIDERVKEIRQDAELKGQAIYGEIPFKVRLIPTPGRLMDYEIKYETLRGYER